MTFLVTDNCIKCKYTDCVDACPVDAFHEGPNFLAINPEVCIDCDLCKAECPAEAIFAEDDLAEPELSYWMNINILGSEQWPVISAMKESLPDAQEYDRILNPDVGDKRDEIEGLEL